MPATAFHAVEASYTVNSFPDQLTAPKLVGSDAVVGPLAKREILRAVHLIHVEDKYAEGMEILCELAGVPVKKLTTTPKALADLMAERPNV